MKLYLIRHGDAEFMANDTVRPLSQQGEREAKSAGHYLLKVDTKVDFIYHSTLRRSRETAEHIAHILNAVALLKERNGLCPEDSPALFAEELQIERQSGAIIGHLPFLQIIASILLLSPSEMLPIKYTPGSILCLEREGYGEWLLRSFTPAKIIAKING